jgi:hypothetical protein
MISALSSSTTGPYSIVTTQASHFIAADRLLDITRILITGPARVRGKHRYAFALSPQ